MLTVWCVWWRDPAAPNKYSAYHVQRLQRTVAENLSVRHRFVCVTNACVEGVQSLRPIVDWPGWWLKLSLFSAGLGRVFGPNLYFDLDTVITGNLDDLAAYADCELAAPANWAQSGHGGIQSSVMAWNGKLTAPFNLFDPRDLNWPPVNQRGVLYGDQEWLTVLRDRGDIEWTATDPTLVRSYKYHCKAGLPADCRVVVFHGEPKPENVKASWFQW